MSHSHLAVAHLVKQLESTVARRSRRQGPRWLTEFVDRVADSFEPLDEVGRVGYQCAPGTECWEVLMYLGRTEVVGGSRDGDAHAVAFQFDVKALYGVFERVEAIRWNVIPPGADLAQAEPASMIDVEGTFKQSRVMLRVMSTAPAEAHPGMRRHADGTWEPA